MINIGWVIAIVGTLFMALGVFLVADAILYFILKKKEEGKC